MTQTPVQRAVFGLLIGGCVLCIPLMAAVRPVAIGIVVQTALLLVLSVLYRRWMRGSMLVPVAAGLAFAAALVALAVALR